MKVVGPDKVSHQLGPRSRRSPDRQADRSGAGRQGRRAHRLALPGEGYYLAKVTVDTDRTTGDATTLVVPRRRRPSPRHLRRRGRRQQGAVRQGRSSARSTRSPRDSSGGGTASSTPTSTPRISAKTIPALYASHGYIDMQVVKDTLIVDRDERQGARPTHGRTKVRSTDRRLRGERREALLERGHRALLSVRATSARRRHRDGEGADRPAARRTTKDVFNAGARGTTRRSKVQDAYDERRLHLREHPPGRRAPQGRPGLGADGRPPLGDRRAHAGDREPRRHRRQRRHDRDVHSRPALHAARATCSTGSG